MNMFALAALLSFFYPKRFLIFYGFASMIGLSRIYVGVHYPSDVLGGVIFGILVACGVYCSYLVIKKKWPQTRSKPQIITRL
jgi:undecaprenyl-diphosphatase